jgi:BirA family biotin operon repressor/biotin-[acetyl-CoA-carboxylase] ligase
VEKLAGIRPAVKWPNDLLAGGRKLAGILIEQRRATVAGVGLNLRPAPAGLVASSLADLGAAVCPLDAAVAVLTALEDRFATLLDDPAMVEADWAAGLGLVGRPVAVELADAPRLAGVLTLVGFDRVVVATPAGPEAVVPERVRHVWPLDGPPSAA